MDFRSILRHAVATCVLLTISTMPAGCSSSDFTGGGRTVVADNSELAKLRGNKDANDGGSPDDTDKADTKAVDGGTGTADTPAAQAPAADEGQPATGDSDTAACVLKGKGHVKPRMVTGNHADETIEATGVVALKVTGNGSHVLLKLTPGHATAVCLFVTGHESVVTVSLESGALVDEFQYKGRGDQALTSVELASGSRIDHVSADLAGHDPHLSFKGPGTYTCPEGATKGTGSTIDCK